MRFASGLPVTLLRALAACDRPVSARILVGTRDRACVCATLNRLRVDGAVDRVKLHGRFRYSITDAGREHLRRLDSGERPPIEGLDEMVAAKLERVLGVA